MQLSGSAIQTAGGSWCFMGVSLWLQTLLDYYKIIRIVIQIIEQHFWLMWNVALIFTLALFRCCWMLLVIFCQSCRICSTNAQGSELGMLKTYMRTIFLTLKSSSGATSGFSPLSVCRTICWTIRSNSTQYCRVAPLCLSAGGDEELLLSPIILRSFKTTGVKVKREILGQGRDRQSYMASWDSAAVWTAGEDKLQCGSDSSWSAQTSGWHF